MARGRKREFDRDKALQAAMLAFWRKGYRATSIPDLCDAMGIRPPSLYAAFGNKESLFVEAVQLYMKATQTLLWNHLDEGRTARASMRDLLIATVTEMTNAKAHPIGCLVSVATVDEDMPQAVGSAIRMARRDWLRVIRNHLQKAIVHGELTASTDVDSLARCFVAFVQSIGVQAHDNTPQGQLEAMVEAAMSIWPRKFPKSRN
jgi:AcrR family transcriptional regulator